MPIIAPDATSPDITVENGQVKPFVFRGCFIDPLQSNTMAAFAANELKAKTAVIYLDSSTDYSKSLAEVFKNKFEALGGKVVMEEAFVAKDQDFKATITNIKTANADIIYIPAYYEEVGKIVKQARELGITQPILGTDGWDDTKVVDIADADALNNTYFITHYTETDPDAKAFVDAFTKEYGHAPGVFAALGYDAGKMLVDAIKRAGSTDPEAIQKALAETKDLQVGTGKLTVDENQADPGHENAALQPGFELFWLDRAGRAAEGQPVARRFGPQQVRRHDGRRGRLHAAEAGGPRLDVLRPAPQGLDRDLAAA